jgi:hypothetical protein
MNERGDAVFDFKFTDSQFRQHMTVMREIRDALNGIKTETTTGFQLVADAIADLTTPEPPPDNVAVEGTLVARYILNEDAVAKDPGPKTFPITCKDLKSAAGTPVGAGDIDLAVESSSANVSASIANQQLSGDGNSVTADVTIEGQAQQPTAELAVVKYTAKNRDTGNEVAADTDEFETGPGEASIGTIDSPVPLTPVDEPPPVV